MKEFEKILEIAAQEVGYLEKATNSQLDDKTANAGDRNFTKYARDMDNLHVYNGPKQGYAWCNVFVDWCFVQALGQDRAAELLIGWSAGCTQDWNWFKSKGQIVKTPAKGDLIFFGDCDHIGIVENFDGTTITTIEGNTSNAAELITNGGTVARKTYPIDSRWIKGFARPKYGEAAEEVPVTPAPVTYALIRRGDKGALVREAQNKLIAKEYPLPKFGPDGDFGAETEEAVKQIQRDAGIDVDGIIGNDTWGLLNGNFHRPNKPLYPGYYIKKGQKGEDVRKVQVRLIQLGFSCGACGADTIFGAGTEKAVIALQRSRGIPADGIVGPQTWNILF